MNKGVNRYTHIDLLKECNNSHLKFLETLRKRQWRSGMWRCSHLFDPGSMFMVQVICWENQLAYSLSKDSDGKMLKAV